MGTRYKPQAFNVSDGTEIYFFFFYPMGSLSLTFALINDGVYKRNWTDTH
jgi:hypothetical protein